MSAIALTGAQLLIGPQSEIAKPVLKKSANGMSEDRVTWHLQNWAEWHRDRKTSFGNGYGSRASGPFVGATNTREFEAMVVEADNRCAAAVEAILDGIPAMQRFSVHHQHLDAVYRFRRAEQVHVVLYANARMAIARGLSIRGIT